MAHEQGKRLLRSAQKQGDENGKKWTYELIAEKVHVEKKTVSRFFGGKEKINFDTAKDICEVLGLDIEDIIDPNDLPSSVQEETEIDWHYVCQKVLVEQQQQQRIRRKITERGYELNMFVPLGLVERREQQRRSGEVSRDEVYQLKDEVITKKYQHDAFLQEVVDHNSSSQKNIAIIGEPGAGKSTLLDKIASWIQANDKGLSICVALGSLQVKTLADYLLENWLEEALNYLDSEQRKDIDPVKNSLKELFRTQPVWLLLDGLDEMATSHNAVASIREQLQGWVGKARVILTSRLNVWDARVNNPLSNFDTYKTLDFTDEQVEDFIDNWFAEMRQGVVGFSPVALKNTSSDKVEQDAEKTDISSESIISELPQLGTQLKAKVRESRYQHLQQLIKNPLRLSLLCQTWYHQQGDLPETKAGLYERFVREFYQEWKPEQHPLTWTKQQQLNEALGKLALRGIDSEARFRLPESLAYEVMREELFLLACDIGWLNLVDRDLATGEPIYAFYHPTFQEYFAATVIDDWDYFLPREHIDRPVPGKKYRIFESEWKEAILLWFGRKKINISNKEEFILNLVVFKDGCGIWDNLKLVDKGIYEYKAYFLATEILIEFQEYKNYHEIVNQIIQYAFGKLDDTKTRNFSHIISKQSEDLLQKLNQDIILNLLVSKTKRIDVAKKIADFLCKTQTDIAINILKDKISGHEHGLDKYYVVLKLLDIMPNDNEAFNHYLESFDYHISQAKKQQSMDDLIVSWFIDDLKFGNNPFLNKDRTTIIINKLINFCLHLIEDKIKFGSYIIEIFISFIENNTVDNVEATNFLLNLVDRNIDAEIKTCALKGLGKIIESQYQAVSYLIKKIEDKINLNNNISFDDDIDKLSVIVFEILHKDKLSILNKTKLSLRVRQLISKKYSSWIRLTFAKMLLLIRRDDSEAIATLSELILVCKDNYIVFSASTFLVSNYSNNLFVIGKSGLEKLIDNNLKHIIQANNHKVTYEAVTVLHACRALGQQDKHNAKVLSGLKYLVEKEFDDENFNLTSIISLLDFDKDNEIGNSKIIDFTYKYNDKNLLLKIANYLLENDSKPIYDNDICLKL
ncbi:MAG: NACHT domain-containing protein, partial [Cyanobacteria bacterium P01_G01_bin.39]